VSKHHTHIYNVLRWNFKGGAISYCRQKHVILFNNNWFQTIYLYNILLLEIIFNVKFNNLQKIVRDCDLTSKQCCNSNSG